MKKNRVFEIDLLRGFLILFVVWDHLLWDIIGLFDISEFTSHFGQTLYTFAGEYRNSLLRDVTLEGFVVSFVILSGISSSFSKNNIKRGIKLTVFAALFTLCTILAGKITKADDITITFNVIHVLSLSILIWSLISFLWNKIRSETVHNILGIVLICIALTGIILGNIYMKRPTNSNSISSFMSFFLYDNKGWAMSPGDYLPLFPYFGWFIFGALFGRVIYKEKKSLFPTAEFKMFSPFIWCGRHSFLIYILSQVVSGGTLLLLVRVLKWL